MLLMKFIINRLNDNLLYSKIPLTVVFREEKKKSGFFFTCDGSLCNLLSLQNYDFPGTQTVRLHIAGGLLQANFLKYKGQNHLTACPYSLLWYIQKSVVKFQVKMYLGYLHTDIKIKCNIWITNFSSGEIVRTMAQSLTCLLQVWMTQ